MNLGPLRRAQVVSVVVGAGRRRRSARSRCLDAQPDAGRLDGQAESLIIDWGRTRTKCQPGSRPAPRRFRNVALCPFRPTADGFTDATTPVGPESSETICAVNLVEARDPAGVRMHLEGDRKLVWPLRPATKNGWPARLLQQRDCQRARGHRLLGRGRPARPTVMRTASTSPGLAQRPAVERQRPVRPVHDDAAGPLARIVKPGLRGEGGRAWRGTRDP